MKVNLLTVGTAGVDLKVNPLFVSNKKLANACNMTFDEGVMRTRPGIRYTSLRARGQFQGATEFRPARGISAESFGDDLFRLVFVVGGGLLYQHEGCFVSSVGSGEEFRCAGPVTLFQAENYVIAQSPCSDTYWWDNVTFTRSPGMNEEVWEDPHVQNTELEIVKPVGVLQECYEDPNTCAVTLRFFCQETGTPLSGVNWEVTYNGTISDTGTTDAEGHSEIRVVPRDYRISASMPGHIGFTDQPLDLSIICTTKDFTISCLPIVSCGTEFDFADTYQGEVWVNLGTLTGDVAFEFDAGSLPARLIVEYNGVIVDDSGYRGDPSYDDELALLGLDPVTGPAGYSGTFLKSLGNPPRLTARVSAPLGAPDWLLTVDCVVPAVEPPETSGGGDADDDDPIVPEDACYCATGLREQGMSAFTLNYDAGLYFYEEDAPIVYAVSELTEDGPCGVANTETLPPRFGSGGAGYAVVNADGSATASDGIFNLTRVSGPNNSPVGTYTGVVDLGSGDITTTLTIFTTECLPPL